MILLLAGPTGTFFGLQGIQRKWQLAEVIYQAGRLEQAWRHRWGQPIHSPAANRFLPLRIAGHWSSIVALATLFTVFATLVVNPGYEFWSDPRYARFAIGLGLYVFVVGLTGLAASVGLALLALKVENQGRKGTSHASKSLALSVPILFVAGTAATLRTPYVPALVTVFLVGGVQYACARGILQKRTLLPQAWNPVRRLVLNLRQLNHDQAHTRWVLLQSSWSSGVEKLPRREAKKAIKEAREWRTNHGLALEFLK
ncbi:hypothetical protein [Pseudarthrobacter sp. S9]|uniref:hypothetical protein n=1 Tax=Pseudarthrobacter sp. S9 TaxID=3418421 RepID=UPI003CFDB8B0